MSNSFDLLQGVFGWLMFLMNPERERFLSDCCSFYALNDAELSWVSGLPATVPAFMLF